MFPDYTNREELHKDELINIYKYGIPKSCLKQYLLQNRDPQHHTKQEFREFCEWLEMAKIIAPRIFVKSKDYNGLRGRFGSNTSNQYKDTRVTTL
jgi:Fe-S-cluster containining protein